MNVPGLHDRAPKPAHTYRYYARITPSFGVPAVYSGDIDGPNCACYGMYHTMLQARIIAWWRNRRRKRPVIRITPRTPAPIRPAIYPESADEALHPEHSFALSTGVCACGAVHPQLGPPGYVRVRMMPGDLFTYRGPAWDVDAGAPEEFVDPLAGPTGKLHLKVVWEYADFIVATEIKHPEQYIIPKRLGTISNRTSRDTL